MTDQTTRLPVRRALMAQLDEQLAVPALKQSQLQIYGRLQRTSYDIATKYPLVPLGLRAIVVVGLIGAAIVHTVLRRLLAIVDTVRGGDPFILDNARRLDAIAWSMLALEVLRMIVLAIAAAVWEPGRLGGFTIAPWFAVLMHK